jgi:predicted unusual protein kinase regulating ubiquinone biosynthesis (AarF/ABC1/UbiB family)
VNNVTSLLKLSGLVPKALDIAPMLAEAKRQLHEEADYEREAKCLARFAHLLTASPEFVVPGLHADLTTRNILAMAYVESVPVETLTDAPQDERDRIVTLLIELLLRELFEFKMMQTDPNFANYRYTKDTGQLVLLDFGATREFGGGVADSYKRLMQAGLSGNRDDARTAILDIGLFDVKTPPQHQDAVMGMFDMAMEPLRAASLFDFGDNDIALQMRDQGMAIAADRDFWHIPPMDTLFLQRKFGGVYLLATRLKARVDVRGLMERYS